MSDSLKEKTGIALFWSFLDKGGQQLIQFGMSCILARILSPDEYGLIAVLAVFTVIANLLQESGFSSALIRKKEVLPQEYSTVFYFNVVTSISIYALLFLGAPIISSFYEKPILTDLARFIFLSFVFNAFGIIQNVNLVRAMDFKTNTRITLISGILAGIIAIAMAISGYGVWSLAVQLVAQSFFRTTLLWIFVKWTPGNLKSHFSMPYLRAMSGYSVKLLLTDLSNQILASIYPIVIGKKFSIGQAGIFNQAQKFNAIPMSIISEGMKNAVYPMLSQVNGDAERQKRAFRKVIRVTAFISFPITCLIFLLAKPIVVIPLSDKWIDVVPILQILAIGFTIYPLHVLISPLLQSLGKSKTLLITELCRNAFLLVSIIVGVQWGLVGLAAGLGISNTLFFIIAMYISGRYINYSLFELAKDIIPYFVIAIITFVPLYFLRRIDEDSLILIPAIQLLTGSCVYLLIVKLSGSVIMKESIEFLKQFRK